MSKLKNMYDDIPANIGKAIPRLPKTSPLMPSPLIPAILNADPMLATDVKNLADADEERRIERLRENGAQGGRPRIVRKDLARACYDDIFADHGQCIMPHYNGRWYMYHDGCYVYMDDENIKKKVRGWLYRDEEADVSRSLVGDVIESLTSDALCGLTTDRYSMPCFLSTGESAGDFIVMQNGIINFEEIMIALQNGSTIPSPCPHTPDLFTILSLPYKFEPTATCPKFEAYLEGVQPNSENREILQMLAGLLLTPDMSFNVAFFIYGQGGTGKTVFMDTLRNLLGSNMCCCVPLACFAERHCTTPLTEKRANIVDEAPIFPENGCFSDFESVFKSVTSGNPIKIEPKYENPREARATARCVFASNTLPTLTDKSNGIWDRIRIIPFNQVFRNTDKQNPNLTEELKEELPGIFNWALRGYLKLRKIAASSSIKTFPQCEEGRVALEQLREDSDHERAFLREATEASSDPEKYLETHDMYLRYKTWALECGYRPVAECNFLKAVKRVYPTAIIDRKRVGTSRPTVAYGIDWFTDRSESTLVIIPTVPVPLVHHEQDGASHEWDSQPDLGF